MALSKLKDVWVDAQNQAYRIARSAAVPLGAQSTSIFIQLDSTSLLRSVQGAFSPTTIEAAAYTQVDGAVPTAYLGRFIISESDDGFVYTPVYTSTTDESSHTYTPTSASVLKVRFSLYLSGGTTTLLDSTDVYVFEASDIDAYYAAEVAAAKLAATLLTLSTTSASRNRAAALTPATVTINASQSGSAYAGRFQISISPDGVSYAVAYSSASDEASKSYSLPATMVVGGQTVFVTSVQVSLYEAGGFTTKLKESYVALYSDMSTTPQYWGALIAAPSAGFVAGDYYFDSNTVALGGGILRYWTGSTWAEMTSAHSLYKTAWGNIALLTDAAEWANTQGSVVAAATAIFDKLFASYVVAAYIFAQQIEVPDGGRIRFYNGKGIQKRCVQLADDRIDWLDTPNDVPADELLRSRIGRLGVNPEVLIDGIFKAPIQSSWSAPVTIRSSYTAYVAAVQLASGELRIAYCHYDDLSLSLYERTYNFSTNAWNSETQISSASCPSPCYIQLSNGQLRIAYRRTSTGYVVERIYDFATSTWGDEINVSDLSVSAATNPQYIQLLDGSLRIAYRRSTTNDLAERIYNFTTSTWGPEQQITPTQVISPRYIQLTNGELRIAYIRSSDNYLIERIYDFNTLSWGNESFINSAASAYPAYIQLIDEELRAAYRRGSDGYLVERIYNVSTLAWGSESIITTNISSEADYIQLADGELRIFFSRSSGGYLVEQRLSRYAQIGSGIIASGSNSNGTYIKFGDGTMKCYGTGTTNPNWTVAVAFPAAFINTTYLFGAFPQHWGTNVSIGSVAEDGDTAGLRGRRTTSSTNVIAAYTQDLVNFGYSIWFDWFAVGQWK